MRRPLLLAFSLCLLAAAPAGAVIPEGNLLANPGAEDGQGAADEFQSFPPPSWQVSPNFTAVQYGAGSGFPDAATSTAIGGGRNFFAGGPDNGTTVSLMFQQVDVSQAAPEIDAGGQQVTIAAQLGGFAGQEDSMIITIVFLDAAGNPSGGTTTPSGTSVSGPDNAERGGATGFVAKSQSAALPPSTRSIGVQVAAQRMSGAYNDGYADNISLTFGGAAPPPEIRETATVSTVSGRVRIRERGTGRFVELEDADSIPLGSEVDATDGTVQLTTAADAQGTTQTGAFSAGRFVMSQTSGNSPITDLRMTGGKAKNCPRRGRGRITTAARRRIRRLRGNATGRFRTRGRYSSATVRGTRWSMKETCRGTRTRVGEGSVTVRDFSKRETITLRAGRSYLARPR